MNTDGDLVHLGERAGTRYPLRGYAPEAGRPPHAVHRERRAGAPTPRSSQSPSQSSQRGTHLGTQSSAQTSAQSRRTSAQSWAQSVVERTVHQAHVRPLVREGLLVLRHPDQRTAADQAYRTAASEGGDE